MCPGSVGSAAAQRGEITRKSFVRDAADSSQVSLERRRGPGVQRLSSYFSGGCCVSLCPPAARSDSDITALCCIFISPSSLIHHAHIQLSVFMLLNKRESLVLFVEDLQRSFYQQIPRLDFSAFKQFARESIGTKCQINVRDLHVNTTIEMAASLEWDHNDKAFDSMQTKHLSTATQAQ